MTQTPNKLGQYIDPTGEYSNLRLKIDNWFLRNKLLLKKIGLWILIVWCCLTISYSIYGWGYYLIFGYKHTEKILQDLMSPQIDYASARIKNSPLPLRTNLSNVYQSGALDKYDFSNEITNDNKNWLAEIEYYFSYNGGITERQTSFIMPGQTQTIAILGQNIGFMPVSPEIVIENTKWKRISEHKIINPKEFVDSRLLFEISNFKFTPFDKNQKIDVNTIEFDLTNNTVYSLWEAKFYVSYLFDTFENGITQITLEEFHKGETRHIELKSLNQNLRINNARISPNINFFDENVYQSIGAK